MAASLITIWGILRRQGPDNHGTMRLTLGVLVIVVFGVVGLLLAASVPDSSRFLKPALLG